MTGPATTHLAELNVARAKYDFEDPRMFEFNLAVDRVYDAAARSPGFVWRLAAPGGGLNSPEDDPRTIINLSVWESLEALGRFTWSGLHREYLDRLDEWFEAPAPVHVVLWRVPIGEEPTIDDGLERLEQLRAEGPSERAFDFRWAKRLEIGQSSFSAARSSCS